MADLQKYIAEIADYTSPVNEKLVEKLYSSLASILGDTDTANVACSDEKELATVKKNFIVNKLGIEDEEMAKKALDAVCEKMSGDRTKNRLVFYYLLTEELDCMKKMTE